VAVAKTAVAATTPAASGRGATAALHGELDLDRHGQRRSGKQQEIRPVQSRPAVRQPAELGARDRAFGPEFGGA
jgi:hypothetical protein